MPVVFFDLTQVTSEYTAQITTTGYSNSGSYAAYNYNYIRKNNNTVDIYNMIRLQYSDGSRTSSANFYNVNRCPYFYIGIY